MTRHAGAVLAMLFLAQAAAVHFTQQGTKLVGTGADGSANQGTSVATSADGTTAIVGGPGESPGSGASWVFIAPVLPPGDVNGDVNGDGTVNVGDVFYLINYLFAGGPAPVGPADVNADSLVNVQDVFYLINYLFAGGPAPVLAEITVFLPGGVPLTLERIPAGTFQMGSPDGERGRYSDETQHEVTLTRDCYLGKTEVTQAQWQAVMGTPMPAECGSYGVGDSYPVYCVSWDEVAGPGGFIEKLNQLLGTTKFRLPTEAEWERGARAETTTRFAHGDVLDCDDECGTCALHAEYMWWCGNNTPNESGPVAGKVPNAYGLYDMHGNVYEWVQDWYGSYPSGAVADPPGPVSGSDRVLRGGFWNGIARCCRSACRGYSGPAARRDLCGFRLARSL